MDAGIRCANHPGAGRVGGAAVTDGRAVACPFCGTSYVEERPCEHHVGLMHVESQDVPIHTWCSRGLDAAGEWAGRFLARIVLMDNPDLATGLANGGGLEDDGGCFQICVPLVRGQPGS